MLALPSRRLTGPPQFGDESHILKQFAVVDGRDGRAMVQLL